MHSFPVWGKINSEVASEIFLQFNFFFYCGNYDFFGIVKSANIIMGRNKFWSSIRNVPSISFSIAVIIGNKKCSLKKNHTPFRYFACTLRVRALFFEYKCIKQDLFLSYKSSPTEYWSRKGVPMLSENIEAEHTVADLER